MPTDDIAQPKPCPHGHHRGIGCEPCTLADLDRVKDPSNFRIKMAVSVLALPALVKQRDEARHDLAKLRAAAESVRKARVWLAECGDRSRVQAQRDLEDAMGVLFDMLPKGDETWPG